MSIKEDLVRKYLVNNVDFKSKDWSLSKIKEEMKKFLGEEPAIDIRWDKDVMINEVSGEAKEFEKLTKVTVIFTDDNNKFKKIEIMV